jgi:prophage regulatory protein
MRRDRARRKGKFNLATVLKPIDIDLPDLPSMVTLDETTIQCRVRERTFPKPRQRSGRRVAVVTEIEEWAEKN